MATKLLVCPPARGDLDDDAPRQWERFVETLACAGDVDLVRMEPVAQLPELAFTANAALLVDTLAIVASFRHAARRRAQHLYRAELVRAGFATSYLQQTYFEGAGDALYDRVRPLLYVGYGWRSERSAALQLQEMVSCRVVPLLLADERFAHLDAALCPLSSGHVLAFMGAFSPHAQTLLRRAIEPEYLIDVGIDDALCMACNAVELGDAVVLNDCSPRLRATLNAIGYRVFRTQLDAFVGAGGGAKRLTLRLDDRPAELAGAATA